MREVDGGRRGGGDATRGRQPAPGGGADAVPGDRSAGTAADEVVAVESLTFAYGSTPVLDVPALRVHSGDIAVLIGHNGSGKTTLLRVVNGLLAPATGSVHFLSEPITTQRGRRLLRGKAVLVHQKPYLFHESVEANIRYVLKLREPHATAEERNARIEEALAAVDLGGLSHRRATALSGGEKQRAAIARALAVRPHLLLLDEPTSNIDPESVRAVEAALRYAARHGTTVLLTTHSLATAYRLGTGISAMNEGRVEADRNNVFHGSVDHTDEYFTYFALRAGGGRLMRAPARNSNAEAAVIPMDDIILSRERLESSAQNHFDGAVTAVEPFAGGRRVSVECGGAEFSALVTSFAVEQLDIAPGEHIHLAFKASAVALY